MGPLLKESFMFKVSENAKTSFFVKSNVVAFVRVTNALSKTASSTMKGIDIPFDIVTPAEGAGVVSILSLGSFG